MRKPPISPAGVRRRVVRQISRRSSPGESLETDDFEATRSRNFTRGYIGFSFRGKIARKTRVSRFEDRVEMEGRTVFCKSSFSLGKLLTYL